MSSDTPADEHLVDAARDGDRGALEALVSRYEPTIYRFSLSLCSDVEDAQEIVQDTFVSMVRGLRTFRADAALSTWLYTIARHACLKRRRRRVAEPASVDSLDSFAPAVREAVASPDASPEDLLSTHDLHASLRKAIGALDVAQREVLLLRDVEGLSAPETARVLGLSVAAVKSRLHRARLAVRERLAPVLGSIASPTARGRCQAMLTQFSQQLEGDLSPATCAELEAHLATCSACRTTCAALTRLLGLCREMIDPVPPTTQVAVRQAIRACLRDGSRVSSGRTSPRVSSGDDRNR